MKNKNKNKKRKNVVTTAAELEAGVTVKQLKSIPLSVEAEAGEDGVTSDAPVSHSANYRMVTDDNDEVNSQGS